MHKTVGEGRMKRVLIGVVFPFGVTTMFQKYMLMMVAQVCKYTKIHLIGHFVKYMICELYLNKVA